MFKIAFRGLKGRGRSNAQLFLVILLAFTFITTSILTYFNLDRNKQTQLQEAYGQYQNAYTGKDETFANSLQQAQDVSSWHRVHILGFSPNAGTVASLSEAFKKDINLKIQSGQWPQGQDEILLEADQLSKFDTTPKVGDVVDIEIQHVLMDRESVKSIKPLILPEEYTILAEDWANTKKSLQKEYLNPDDLKYFGLDYVNGDEKIIKKKFQSLVDNHHKDSQYAFFPVRRLQRSILPTQEISYYDVGTYRVHYYASLLEYARRLEAAKPKEKRKEINLPYKDTQTLKTTIPYRKTVTVYKKFKVAGILAPYSNKHNLPEETMPTALISQEAAQSVAASQNEAFRAVKETSRAGYLYLVNSPQGSEAYYAAHRTDPGLIRNELAYPTKAWTAENAIALALILFIYLQTLLSLGQIFLIQFKKRQRNLALFKAIGANNGQLRSLLLFETLILIGLALPLGVLLGYALAHLLLYGYGQVQGRPIPVAIPWLPLLLGLFITVLTSFLGILYPMVKVAGIPLTGAISTHTKKRRRFKSKAQFSLNSLFARHMAGRRKQSITSFILYAIIISSLLLSSFLSYLAFLPYKEKVIETNKPSFVLRDDVATYDSLRPLIKRSLRKIPHLKEHQILNFKLGAFEELSEETLSPLQKALQKATPEGYKYTFQHDTGKQIAESQVRMDPNEVLKLIALSEKAPKPKLTLMSIPLEGPILPILKASSQNLRYDDAAFRAGNQVFILFPRYRLQANPSEFTQLERLKELWPWEIKQKIMEETKFAQASYLKRYEDLLPQDPLYAKKAEVNIISRREDFLSGGEEVVTPAEAYALGHHSVAGFISTLDQGIWPLSGNNDFPVIIGSQEFLNKFIYNFAYSLASGPAQKMKVRTYLEMMGKTMINIYLTPAGKKAASEVESALEKEMTPYGYTIMNLEKENADLLNNASLFSIAFLLFGLVLAILSFQIQFNSTKASLDEEQAYIGILQSLGVTGRSLSWRYLWSYLRLGILSLVPAHLILGAVYSLFAVRKYGWDAFLNLAGPIFRNEMAQYPWHWHSLACLLFILFVLILSYLPLNKRLHRQPIDNIRS